MSACFDITDYISYDNRSGLQILNSGGKVSTIKKENE